MAPTWKRVLAVLMERGTVRKRDQGPTQEAGLAESRARRDLKSLDRAARCRWLKLVIADEQALTSIAHSVASERV